MDVARADPPASVRGVTTGDAILPVSAPPTPRSPAFMSNSAYLPPLPKHSAGRRGRTLTLALAAWFAVNLLMLSGDFRAVVLLGGAPATPLTALLLAVPTSLVLTAAGWAAFRLTRRRAIARRGFFLSLAMHAASGVAFAALDIAVRKAERLLLAEPGTGFAPSRDPGEFVGVLVIYALLTLVAHAVEYARRFRERQLAELRLQASLARAELERAAAELRVLKLQLNPHFLFNSLHAVSALVHDAPDAAERMVVRLGDLLRHAATRVGTQEVPLDEEVRTLAPFLEVEAIRLGGRLRVEWDVEEAARGAYVPHMVLQPLAENAVKHGLAGRDGGGRVEISARRRGAWLELAVRDDGVGMAAAVERRAPGSGIGTANTRARLEQLYGEHHALEMAPAEGGGTRVAVRVPWHEAPWPSRALEGSASHGGADAATPPSGSRWGRVVAGAVFLLMWADGYRRMLGTPAASHEVVSATEAAVCGGLNAMVTTLMLASAFVLARRAPVMGGGKGKALLRHARAALLLGAAVTLERKLCALVWGMPLADLTAPGALRLMGDEILSTVVVFTVVSLAAHALEYARRSRQKEASGLRLQASLARAELERTSAELRGLKMQVNPRFLFTALEAVAARVRQAPAEAERMVVRLADLLRQAMESAGTHEVPLEEEVRALEPFLEVERIRLGGRLRVEWRVDDETLDAFVPPRVLQPMVEEAVARGGHGCVAIAARRRGDWLELEVRDDSAPPSAAEASLPVGGGAAVETSAAEGGGTRAVLRLPWHDEPWPRPAAAVGMIPEPSLAP
jgi:two-component system LytT family sensor kinase